MTIPYEILGFQGCFNYEYKALDDDDFKELMEFSKPINSSRDYITKEKDDYER